VIDRLEQLPGWCALLPQLHCLRGGGLRRAADQIGLAPVEGDARADGVVGHTQGRRRYRLRCAEALQCVGGGLARKVLSNHRQNLVELLSLSHSRRRRAELGQGDREGNLTPRRADRPHLSIEMPGRVGAIFIACSLQRRLQNRVNRVWELHVLGLSRSLFSRGENFQRG